MEFFICEHCKNIVQMVKNVGVPIVCCGAKMTKLESGVTDAATEKHVPVVTVSGNSVMVEVGSVQHPMSEEHLIQWVAIETKNGSQIKYFDATVSPKASFSLVDDELIAVYEYCNLHGLWKKEM